MEECKHWHEEVQAQVAGEEPGRAAESLQLKKYAKLLCAKCGWPNCQCRACAQTLGHGNAKEKHKCWLAEYGPHPLSVHSDPITNKRVNAEWQHLRSAAWHQLGTKHLRVQWDGKRKGYKLESAMKKRKHEEEEPVGEEAAEAEEKGEEAAGEEAQEAEETGKEAEEAGEVEEKQEEEEAPCVGISSSM